MKKVYVNGVGQTKFGELWHQGLSDLMVEAARKAIADAHLEAHEIDYVIVGSMIAEGVTGQGNLGALLCEKLGMVAPALRIEGACASGGVSVATACDVVAAGRARNVLVVGVEKMTDKASQQVAEYLMQAADAVFDTFCGLTFPGIFGLVAQAYLHTHKISQEKLAFPSVRSHANAQANPFAHFSHPLTIQEVMNAPQVASPLGILHCAPISDGAAALILSADKQERSVEVIAAEIAVDTLSLTRRSKIDEFTATKKSLHAALSKACMTINEVDIFEVHDGFSIVEIITMEDFGLCKKGFGADIISEGQTQRDGPYPVNSTGGLKAGGHPVGATGVRQIVTLVRNLRGDERLLKDMPEIGLAHNVGGVGSIVSIHILKR